jgi:DNA-binding NtrC family response regulator
MTTRISGEIAVVDDDRRVVSLLSSIFDGEGYHTGGAYSAEQALRLFEEQDFDMAFIDYRLPGKDGLELLREIKARWPETEVVMITGEGNIEIAVEAMKLGACDFVPKPFTVDLIQITVKKVLEKCHLRKQTEFLGELSVVGGIERPVIAESPGMKDLFRLIKTAAVADANILVTGETGVGKEVVARTIHQMSSRKGKPFIPVDCASIPDSLLESTFFGHERGAFTDAHQSKPGMVEIANTGTLFLDEIGEMPLSLQAKILRLLQERTFRRVGGAKEKSVDILIIAATNRDIDRMVQEETFRSDLYYRLQVVALHVPPLRERREDILPLALSFIDRCKRKNHKEIQGLTPEAAAMLLNYSWPGNVRELENTIERAVIFCDAPHITKRDLFNIPESVSGIPDSSAIPADTIRLDMNLPDELPLKEFREIAVRKMERLYVERLLERCGGNVTQAARKAGIARRSFYRLIDRSGACDEADNPD